MKVAVSVTKVFETDCRSMEELGNRLVLPPQHPDYYLHIDWYTVSAERVIWNWREEKE